MVVFGMVTTVEILNLHQMWSIKKKFKKIKRDTLVNNYFMNKGWFIVRIKECEIKKNEEQVADKIKNLLRESSLIY